MIAVIFEVWPASGGEHEYLKLAAELKRELEQSDGFVSVERFQSLSEPGKLLSLSFFRDEAAVATWRKHLAHRAAQHAGIDGLFRDYRLRVAEVQRDYGRNAREEAPQDHPDRVS